MLFIILALSIHLLAGNLSSDVLVSSKDSFVVWNGIKNGIHLPLNYFYIYAKDSNGNPLKVMLSNYINS